MKPGLPSISEHVPETFQCRFNQSNAAATCARPASFKPVAIISCVAIVFSPIEFH